MYFYLADYITAFLIFLGAILYSSVGHGGASSYIAIMSLMGTPIGTIKPIGLMLNIIVSSISGFRFIKRNFFSFKVFLPVAIGSIPAAYMGGYIDLPSELYRPLIGFVLIIAGTQFLFNFYQYARKPGSKVNFFVAFLGGAIIGLLSGLTGTGGGIFLSPLIIFLGWTTVKQASGTAALFIFFNSISGLFGNLTSMKSLPPTIFLFSGAVLVGVLIGTQLGLKHLKISGIQKALGLVLVIAGLKFLIT
jgi:uncharacterized membrane protein YfcA